MLNILVGGRAFVLMKELPGLPFLAIRMITSRTLLLNDAHALEALPNTLMYFNKRFLTVR